MSKPKPIEMVEIDPLDVIVREGLDRYRKDAGDVQELATSMQRVGQILPIAITTDNELIDGGRRVAAAMLANIKLTAVRYDNPDDYELRELELEANLCRKDFTPAEEALAIRDLHERKQKRLGKGDAGWSITKTAEVLGKSRGTVYNALEAAETIDAFPELGSAKTRTELRKACKGFQRLVSNQANAEKYQEAIKSEHARFEIHHQDALRHIKEVDSGYFNIICTDPIYGIGADLLNKSLGNTPGGLSISGYRIEDKKEAAFLYYKAVAEEGYRITTPDAHCWCFVGPEHFWTIRNIFLSAKWLVHVKPLIWIKRASGQCNVPTAWPASCYEMILYARKEKSAFIREGAPDWMQYSPVNPSERTHPYEKPKPLIDDLLGRVSLPGQRLYDPFMGSGVTIESGIENSLFCVGVDNSQEAYNAAAARLAKKGKLNE